MRVAGTKSKPALGFLTVLKHPEHGLFGGYLLLTMAGRPLEFHCTAPVKPNRAQQILYGPTLQPFLFGEQIGHTLLAKSKIEPLVVCTDLEPALAVREYVSVPVVLVLPPEEPDDPCGQTGGPIRRLDGAHLPGQSLTVFTLGCNRLAVPGPGEEDRQTITTRLVELAESFDLAEPFGRIREAIEEARQGGQ